MAKPIYTEKEAKDQVLALAKKGFLIQQLSPHHFRIPFTGEIYVDWWPTTCKFRIITPDILGNVTLTAMLTQQLETILRGLHYAVFGREPQPVVHTRQQEPDRLEPPQEPRRTRARRPVPEGGPRTVDLCDESSPPWDE